MSRETIVLGAGMVGVSIAWHLARRGRSVTLVDRRAPGRETSFGNGGLIQREAVRPYPFPRSIGKLLAVLPNRRADIRYSWRGMLESAGPLFDYWRYSERHRYARIVPEYASLIMHATEEHAPMIEAANADHLVRKDGWLEVYRDSAGLDVRTQEADEAAERFGVTHEVLDAGALQRREPALSDSLAGAIHWTNSWGVVDPGALVGAYADAFRREGGRYLEASLLGLTQTDRGWRVETDAGTEEAQDVVVALGPWSGSWLRTLGYRLPTFVKRGYHMHFGSGREAVLAHWVADVEVGYILAPMQAGTRLTTGAELERLDAPPHHGQLATAEARARQLYPGLGARLDDEPWKGARPCLPDMKPVIGPAARHAGLWFAFGHGHQGFTLGPVTGRVLAEMMDGETPVVDMTPFRADRF